MAFDRLSGQVIRILVIYSQPTSYYSVPIINLCSSIIFLTATKQGQ